MPDFEELLFGQAVAVAIGFFFAGAEWLRLKKVTELAGRWATLEGVRMWGFVAIATACIWLAARSEAMAARIAYGVISPVLAALIFNNLHVALHKRFILRAEK